MTNNSIVYLILVAYLAVTFLTSLIGRKAGGEDPESYFMANRNLNVLTLFFTLIATNFSAFFFLGFAGEGYRIGYAYYAMMAIGTAFAAISFYLIGSKVWKLGKTHGFITPPELVGALSGSPFLKYTFLIVMIAFTLPYLSLQPIGAGYILEKLTGGEIPYFTGALLLTIFIIFYVFYGGMRSVANTDVKQGILMIILMLAALWIISDSLGGIAEANRRVFALKPALFTRSGMENYFTPGRWFSFCLLWIACVPMFPQLFMRFFIARNPRTFRTTTILYAFIPCFLFILPVAIGVLGHLAYPDLSGREADQILPMMLVKYAPGWFAALVMTGALAAFMSTVDSQLLALSTMGTRDVYMPLFHPGAGLKEQVWVGKILVVIFAGIGLWIAYKPFATIFDIVRMAFTGYAALFPVVLALLYWRQTNATVCALTIIIAELLVVGFHFHWLPEELLLGFEPVIPVLLLEGFMISIGSLLFPRSHP
jgi:SSS family solute:Na+ symporter